MCENVVGFLMNFMGGFLHPHGMDTKSGSVSGSIGACTSAHHRLRFLQEPQSKQRPYLPAVMPIEHEEAHRASGHSCRLDEGS